MDSAASPDSSLASLPGSTPMVVPPALLAPLQAASMTPLFLHVAVKDTQKGVRRKHEWLATAGPSTSRRGLCVQVCGAREQLRVLSVGWGMHVNQMGHERSHMHDGRLKGTYVLTGCMHLA